MPLSRHSCSADGQGGTTKKVTPFPPHLSRQLERSSALPGLLKPILWAKKSGNQTGNVFAWASIASVASCGPAWVYTAEVPTWATEFLWRRMSPVPCPILVPHEKGQGCHLICFEMVTRP